MVEEIFEKITNASLQFLEPFSTREMYKIIVDEAKQLVAAEYGSISLIKDKQLTREYTDAQFLEKVPVRKKGFTYKSITTLSPFIVDTVKEKNIHEAIMRNGIRSLLHIPLSYKKQTVGDLTLYLKTKLSLKEKELTALKLYGSMASLAIRKTQLYQETIGALEVRDLFISTASHELRTPLTSLNGYIQLLAKRMGEKKTVDAKYVHELEVESLRLTTIVKELLEVNRLKQGQMQFAYQECVLSDIVKKSIEQMKLLGIQRNIIVSNKIAKAQDMIIGDPDKLQQVFFSILHNAAKFSQSDVPIHVSLRLKEKSLSVIVQDTGKGINKGDLPRVFDGFYKGVDNHQEGMGVGLMLAKHIIVGHHGRIRIMSEESVGTTLEVLLPKIRSESN